MSVLSLTNPLTAAPPPSSSGSTDTAAPGATVPSEPSPSDTVQPSPQSGTENTSGSSTGSSGTGAGAGGSGAEAPLRFSSAERFARPADATPNSVVNAQVAGSTDAEIRARDTAIAQQARQRDADLISGLTEQTQTDADAQTDLLQAPSPEAKKAMPDPLPTSPFLKRGAA